MILWFSHPFIRSKSVDAASHGETDRFNRYCVLLVAILASFATLPLFLPYFFSSSDGMFHLLRLMEYDTLIRQGIWYPRWAADFFFGLGMPLFNFYAPLSYYMAEVFHALGAGYIGSFYLLCAAAMALSGIGAYAYARTLLSPISSLFAAVVYMYVPYHLVNLYFRADLAEYIAYMWFPFILWSINRAVQRGPWSGGRNYLLAGALFYAALILTHNLSAFIFSGFLFLYCAAALLREYIGARPGPTRPRVLAKNCLALLAMALLALALTAFFWGPALTEKSVVTFDRLLQHYNYHDSFPTVGQLLSTDLIHRYGAVLAGADIYSYKLGLLQILLIALGALLALWRFRLLASRLRIELVTAMVVVSISCFFILPVSLSVWDAIPLLSLTQFPWRFLAFIALPGSFLAGFLIELLPFRLRSFASGMLIPLVIISSVGAMVPVFSNVQEANISPKGSVDFELTQGNIGTSAASEYLPAWVKDIPSISPMALSSVLGTSIAGSAGRASSGIQAAQLEKRADGATFSLHATRAGTFVPYIVYFPGWVGELDGQSVPLGIDDPSGLIKVDIPTGEHSLTLRFTETPQRQLFDALSALALLLVLGVLTPWSAERVWSAKACLRRRAMRRLAAASQDAVQWSRHENLVKVGIVVFVILAWLAFRTIYNALYAPAGTYGRPLSVNLEDQVQLLGYDIAGGGGPPGPAATLTPGAGMKVTLYWRLLKGMDASGYRPFVRLTNNYHQTWAFTEAEANGSSISNVPAGAISTPLELTVPIGTPPGIYEIEIGFTEASSGHLLDTRRAQLVPVLPEERGVRFGPIIVARNGPAGGERLPPRAGNTLAAAVTFGDLLRLSGLTASEIGDPGSGRLDRELSNADSAQPLRSRAGQVLHLDMQWQAIADIHDDLTFTARLAGQNRTYWAIRDSRPADGRFPTIFWQKGEVVRDQLNLTIPPETPPGHYELQLEAVSGTLPLTVKDEQGTPLGPTLRVGELDVLPSEQPADPNALKIAQRRDVSLLYGLNLLGYNLGRSELKPGDRLDVDLFWRAARPIDGDLTVTLEIAGASGSFGTTGFIRPVGDAYPTNAWRQGEVLRSQYSLTVGASAPEGEARLRLAVVDRASGQILDTVDLAPLNILPRARSAVALPGHALEQVFGDKMRLQGYDLSSRDVPPGHLYPENEAPEVAPGDEIKIRLVWEALEQMETSYTVFAQVLNGNGQLVAQHDALPQGGNAPTTAWLPGEVQDDEHQVLLPVSLPAGDYTLIVGVYDAATGKRLSAADGRDFVLISPLRISSVPAR